MKRVLSTFLRLLLTVTLPCALLACGGPSPVEEATANNVLLLGNGAEPKALDPHLVSSVGDSNILLSLFEGLCAFHPSDDNMSIPGAAESWESNEDYTVWTFHLRKNGRWSNGDPVTAHDFVYAYERILTPAMGSPYSSMLYFLKNGAKFNQEEIDSFDEVGVKALDDYTLECTLEQPTAFFPELTKHTTYYPVHRATIEKFGSMTDQFTKWQRPGNHVSNGAFKLKSWWINHSVVVEPNPYYWDKDTVTLKEIHFIPMTEFTEERAFRAEQLHYTYAMPSNLIPWYGEHYPDLVRREPYYGSYFYRYNTTKPPLDNLKLRQALAYAIDRNAIIDNVTLGNQTPAGGFTPPTPGGYQPPTPYSFDPEKARQLLQEAGYADGGEVPEFEILMNTHESHRAIAEAIQDMWRKHLGLTNVSIANQEWKVFQSTIIEMKYDVGRAGWIGDYMDPTTFLDMWRTDDSNNNTGWSNPDYDRYLKEAALEPTPEARLAKLHAAEEILMAELPVLPIYWYTRNYLIHPDVQNWNPLLLDHHNYKFIHLKAAPPHPFFKR